jgi:hypothetical protein
MMSEPIPDRPVIFGYKQIWLAISATAPQVVADAIGLIDARTSTWKEGIERSYEQGYDREQRQFREWQEIFVSPPVLSWILAVGGIGALPNACLPEWLPWLRNLSALLGHVQSFGTHRVSSAAYWAKARDGRIIRACGYMDGRTLVNEGDLTPEEIALGFDFRPHTAGRVRDRRGPRIDRVAQKATDLMDMMDHCGRVGGFVIICSAGATPRPFAHGMNNSWRGQSGPGRSRGRSE